MLPSIRRSFGLFDDFFDDPFFNNSKKETRNELMIMQTDIQEKNGKYLISIDLPGYDKENINIELENGYLTISANTVKENTVDNEGYIKRERYSGDCRRTFYVGDSISEDDIKAKFKNGTLQISVPKEKEIKKETKKLIDIE